MSEIEKKENIIINIDASHVYYFDSALYYQIINFPTEIIPIINYVTNTICCDLFKKETKSISHSFVNISIHNLIEKNRIRDLEPTDAEKLVSISGVIIRISEVIPEMSEAHFRCNRCGQTEKGMLHHGKINEPTECKNCKSKLSFELKINRSLYKNKQIIKVQDNPEDIQEEETPSSIELCCYDQLLNLVKVGDYCDIVGILKIQSIRINKRERTESDYKIYVDAVSIKINNIKSLFTQGKINNLALKNTSIKLNDNDMKTMKEQIEILKKNPNIYQILVDSFATSICGNEDVKKGLLLQLFGGVSKDFSKSAKDKFNGNIKVLLLGDPSTAKSQFLQYINNVFKRGIYISGKSTSFGISPNITKDPETKEIILEAGSLIFSDNGICCIDGLDQIDKNTSKILHQVLEGQKVLISKEGIVCQLDANSAILASANLKNNPNYSELYLSKSIDFSEKLISKFDIIYFMLDEKGNDNNDKDIANHILSLYDKFDDIKDKCEKNTISKELLRAYIMEARNHSPKIHENVVPDLKKFYVELRSLSRSKISILVTPRHLESLIRLSEARARLRFSEFVEKDDVCEAFRLIKFATYQIRAEIVSRIIDMNMIKIFNHYELTEKLNLMVKIVKNILRDYSDIAKKGVKFSSISDEVKKRGDCLENSKCFYFTEKELRLVLNSLEEEDIIYNLGTIKNPIIRLTGTSYE